MFLIEAVRRFFRRKPEPDLGIARGKCPFYGFTAGMVSSPGDISIMMDTSGNGCPLEGNLAHSPCKMAMNGLEPTWSSCTRFNNAENKKAVESILDKFAIFPREHWPEGEEQWEGIPLRAWFEAIANRQDQG